MQAIIKSLNIETSKCVKYAHAPSLSAAIRADAELLVNLCVDNRMTDSEGMLVNYILGNVNADVNKIDSAAYLVSFYKESDTKPFVTVEVK